MGGMYDVKIRASIGNLVRQHHCARRLMERLGAARPDPHYYRFTRQTGRGFLMLLERKPRGALSRRQYNQEGLHFEVNNRARSLLRHCRAYDDDCRGYVRLERYGGGLLQCPEQSAALRSQRYCRVPRKFFEGAAETSTRPS